MSSRIFRRKVTLRSSRQPTYKYRSSQHACWKLTTAQNLNCTTCYDPVKKCLKSPCWKCTRVSETNNKLTRAIRSCGNTCCVPTKWFRKLRTLSIWRNQGPIGCQYRLRIFVTYSSRTNLSGTAGSWCTVTIHDFCLLYFVFIYSNSWW